MTFERHHDAGAIVHMGDSYNLNKNEINFTRPMGERRTLPGVRATLCGVRRTLGVKQRQAQALLRADLFAVLDLLGDRTKDHRDRTMNRPGIAGGVFV